MEAYLKYLYEYFNFTCEPGPVTSVNDSCDLLSNTSESLTVENNSNNDDINNSWPVLDSIRNFFSVTVMEHFQKEFTDITMSKVFNWIASLGLIIGGVVPFIPQYIDIKKKNDSEGFSLYVCLVLITANILRILFWLGKRYELPLLIQSIIMNITMLLMIHLCVTVRRKHMHGPEHTFTDFDYKYFWEWTDFHSYLEFIFLMTTVFSSITFLCMRYSLFVEILGYAATISEAMLAVPQLVENYRLKSTEGMSIMMVLFWTCGDIFKTAYFVKNKTPPQFWCCGCLQVTIDLLILFQVYLYQGNQKDHLKVVVKMPILKSKNFKKVQKEKAESMDASEIC